MKFSTTLVALVAAGLASAQLPDVPPCSLSCFVSALSSDGCSELLDFECHCQKTELVSSITPCVEKACEVKDQISVSNAVTDQCKSAGHPISIPPIETEKPEPTTTAEETTTAAPEPTSTDAEPSVEPTPTPSESSSAVEPTVPAPTASTPIGSSGVATSTPLVTKTGSGSEPSSSPIYTGAAVNVKGNLAGVAAFAAAAAYVL